MDTRKTAEIAPAPAGGHAPGPGRPAEGHRSSANDAPAQPLFDDITALAARCCATPMALISLLDEDRLWFRSSHGLSIRHAPRSGSMCERVIALDKLLHVHDMLAAGMGPAAILLPQGRIARFYAGVPIRGADGRAIGVLCVMDHEPRQLDEQQRDTLHRLARQAAAVLESARASAGLLKARRQLEHRANFNEVHARASQLIASSDAVQPMLQAICDTAVRHSRILLAFVSRPDGAGRFEFAAAAGEVDYLRGLELRTQAAHVHGNGPVAAVWRSGQAFFAASFEGAPELRPWHEAGRRFGFRSSATVPILRGGRVWATFTAHHAEEGAFDGESRAVMLELALNLSRGLDRIDAQRREKDLVELQRTLLDNTLAGILIKRDRRIVSTNSRFAAMLGYDGPQQLVGTSAREIYPDDAEFRRIEQLYARLSGGGQVRAMDVRLRRRDGSELLCDASAGTVRDAQVETVVWTYVDVTERSRLQRKLRHDALHDALSDLPNRRALDEHVPRALARARRQGRLVAVGMIDLDDFKPVNDRHGHGAGDELLREFARRLSGLMRASDLLARMGGDEFVVVLEDLEQAQLDAQLGALMTRLHQAVEAPFALAGGATARIGMTVGIAVHPLHGDDADSLLRQADAALYQLKARKFDRRSWWQLGVHAAPDDEESGIGAYGEEAAALLRQHGATLRDAVARFVIGLRDGAAADPGAAGLLACLAPGEIDAAARGYARHLELVLGPGTTRADIEAHAEAIGQLQALVGIEPAQLVSTIGGIRRSAMQSCVAARIATGPRYRLLRLIEERLEDDLQAQLRAASRTAGAYFKALVNEAELPETLWRDALRSMIEPIGNLPGMLACVVLRPNAQAVFEIEAAAGPSAEIFSKLLVSPANAIRLDTRAADAQTLVSLAWRTHKVHSSGRFDQDERLTRWRGLARSLGVRSSVAIPVLASPGRCSMVISLLGAHAHQFEAPWMRQFVRTLQSHANRASRASRAPSAALMLSQDVAQGYRERLFDGGLRMYVQPVVDLHGGPCTKVEALARLELADGRVVAPAYFLPILGEAELDRLFREGLEQTCAQLRAWEGEGLRVDATINLPPSSLLDASCATWVEAALARHAIEPRRLTLELLESQELDFQAQHAALHSLRELGVRLAMDDLGAGYSSLQRLARLPFDTIKVDQGLSLNMRKDPLQTLSLIRAIVRLASDLGRELVVEGLEDRGVIEAALECGARYGQGYGIARPMPAEAFAAWRRDYRPGTQPGEIASFLGMLACCWRLGRRAQEQVPSGTQERVLRFLARRSLAQGELAGWYASLGAGGRLDDAEGARLVDWLLQQVRSEAEESRVA